jgi:hypothetical protein
VPLLASVSVKRDVVIHLLNEQPLLADLPELPSPGDQALLCTNLRTLSRKRPVFVDHSGSTFVIPYSQIRFLEIPRETEAHADQPPALAPVADEPNDIELDEELLRRVREL